MEEELCRIYVEEDDSDFDETDSGEYMSEFLNENGEHILNQVKVWTVYPMKLISNRTKFISEFSNLSF